MLINVCIIEAEGVVCATLQKILEDIIYLIDFLK